MTPRAIALVAAMAVVALGCGPRASEPAARAASTVDRPTIEHVGCRHVDAAGRACHLLAGKPATLRIWVDIREDAPMVVRIDGLPVEPTARVGADGGARLEISIPPEARLLEAQGSDPRWREPLTLALVREQLPPVVVEARGLLRTDPQAALAMLDEALPGLEGRARLDGLQLSWKLMLQLGDARANDRIQEAVELARELGRSRELTQAAGTAVWLSLSTHEFVAARRWAEVLSAEANSPEQRVWADHYAGGVARVTGDLGGAIRAFRRARAGAWHLGMTTELAGASQFLTSLFASLGRVDEVRSLSAENLELARDLSCPERARLLGNTGWAQIILARAGLDYESPAALFESGLADVGEDGDCPRPLIAGHLRVDLAELALVEAELNEASSWLSELRSHDVPVQLVDWVDLLEIRLSAERNEALPLIHLSVPSDSDLAYPTMLAEARRFEREGFADVAVSAYLSADDMLDDQLSTLALGEGRSGFVSGQNQAAERAVDLLVAGKNIERAFCRARLSRGRAFRDLNRSSQIAALTPEGRRQRDEVLEEAVRAAELLADDAREDWRFAVGERKRRRARRASREAEVDAMLDRAIRLGFEAAPTCDELPARNPGELWLLPFPGRAEGEGSWVFLYDDEGLEVLPSARLTEGSDQWAMDILDLRSDKVRAAQKVRVLATGPAWATRFHALPLEGGVVLDVTSVAYALDRPRRSPGQEGPPESARAVVVADPLEDLPLARAEGQSVVQALTSRGWNVEAFIGGSARREAVLAGMAGADLVHFSGHGRQLPNASWDARLIVADEEAISVADILLCTPAPRQVVLSSCDTAEVNHLELSGGMNLARAFVLAGSEWVIAADEQVSDVLAKHVGEGVHVSGEQLDGADRLRRVQLRVSEEMPAAEWAAFRVVEP